MIRRTLFFSVSLFKIILGYLRYRCIYFANCSGVYSNSLQRQLIVGGAFIVVLCTFWSCSREKALELPPVKLNSLSLRPPQPLCSRFFFIFLLIPPPPDYPMTVSYCILWSAAPFIDSLFVPDSSRKSWVSTAACITSTTSLLIEILSWYCSSPIYAKFSAWIPLAWILLSSVLSASSLIMYFVASSGIGWASFTRCIPIGLGGWMKDSSPIEVAAYS